MSDEDSRTQWDLIGANRKSAFLPYKSTVLTNLQRGNTQANICENISLNFHEKSGQGEITEEQIKQEKNVDFLDSYGFSGLHYACYYGQISSASLLIQQGADVNKLATDLISPLLLASAGGHHEIARLLLQKGADINHLDILGNSCLIYAAAGNHPHTCNEILLYKPSITHTNEDGETAYNLAIKNNAHLSQAVLENYLVSLLTN